MESSPVGDETGAQVVSDASNDASSLDTVGESAVSATIDESVGDVTDELLSQGLSDAVEEAVITEVPEAVVDALAEDMTDALPPVAEELIINSDGLPGEIQASTGINLDVPVATGDVDGIGILGEDSLSVPSPLDGGVDPTVPGSFDAPVPPGKVDGVSSSSTGNLDVPAPSGPGSTEMVGTPFDSIGEIGSADPPRDATMPSDDGGIFRGGSTSWLQQQFGSNINPTSGETGDTVTPTPDFAGTEQYGGTQTPTGWGSRWWNQFVQQRHGSDATAGGATTPVDEAGATFTGPEISGRPPGETEDVSSGTGAGATRPVDGSGGFGGQRGPAVPGLFQGKGGLPDAAAGGATTPVDETGSGSSGPEITGRPPSAGGDPSSGVDGGVIDPSDLSYSSEAAASDDNPPPPPPPPPEPNPTYAERYKELVVDPVVDAAKKAWTAAGGADVPYRLDPPNSGGGIRGDVAEIASLSEGDAAESADPGSALLPYDADGAGDHTTVDGGLGLVNPWYGRMSFGGSSGVFGGIPDEIVSEALGDVTDDVTDFGGLSDEGATEFLDDGFL